MSRVRRRIDVSRALAAFGVFLVVWIGGGLEAARADEVPYRHFTTLDGLPHESVTALAQTPSGLLWVGTRDGLAVYDGREFRTIPLPDSIAAGPITGLQPDRRDRSGLGFTVGRR